jgi:hypothetical protein
LAINIKYLKEYLTGKDGLVTIVVTTPSSPILFHYGKAPGVIVMPMFVQWNDVTPAESENAAAAAQEAAPPAAPADQSPEEVNQNVDQGEHEADDEAKEPTED